MMQSLFSAAGRACLDRIVQPGLLCAFDFDGTLAPISSEPAHARMAPEVHERLLGLSSLTPIAVLTGRSLADIRARLGFDPPYVVGNHGLEGMGDDEVALAQHEACCRAWRAQLAPMLAQDTVRGTGIVLEDKRYSLSLHYRAAPDHAASAAWLAALAARLEPAPRIVGGKCVLNLLPPGVADKGLALDELMRRSGAPAAIYIGDDVTDEAVFRLRRPGLLSVRVECTTGSAAEFCIPGHGDIGRLLDDLTSRLRQLEHGKAVQLAGPRQAPGHGHGR